MSQLQVLLPPAIAMMALAFMLSVAMRHFRSTRYEQIAFGLMFGIVIMISMANPIPIGDGLIFDSRTLLVGAAVAFVGPLAGAIAVTFGVFFRFYIGGASVFTGCAALLLAYGLARLWQARLGSALRHPNLHDMALGAFITFSAKAVFLLPFDLAVEVLGNAILPLLTCNVLGMAAIGYVFRREAAYVSERNLMKKHARTDALTALLNRRGMDCALEKTQFDPKHGHALLYFDIDDFKHVNDIYGHDAGDAALAIVAARLKVIVRDEAVFARHGGDEFSIYFPKLSASDVKGVADRLCRAISDQSFSHQGKLFAVSITIGGFWSKKNLSIDTMIKRADQELMLAKSAGKNRARVAFDRQDPVSVVA